MEEEVIVEEGVEDVEDPKVHHRVVVMATHILDDNLMAIVVIVVEEEEAGRMMVNEVKQEEVGIHLRHKATIVILRSEWPIQDKQGDVS